MSIPFKVEEIFSVNPLTSSWHHSSFSEGSHGNSTAFVPLSELPSHTHQNSDFLLQCLTDGGWLLEAIQRLDNVIGHEK